MMKTCGLQNQKRSSSHAKDNCPDQKKMDQSAHVSVAAKGGQMSPDKRNVSENSSSHIADNHTDQKQVSQESSMPAATKTGQKSSHEDTENDKARNKTAKGNGQKETAPAQGLTVF